MNDINNINNLLCTYDQRDSNIEYLEKNKTIAPARHLTIYTKRKIVVQSKIYTAHASAADRRIIEKKEEKQKKKKKRNNHYRVWNWCNTNG